MAGNNSSYFRGEQAMPASLFVFCGNELVFLPEKKPENDRCEELLIISTI